MDSVATQRSSSSGFARPNSRRLRDELTLRCLTAEELSRRAGVSRLTVARALRGERVQYLTLLRIVRALTDTPVIEGAAALLALEAEPGDGVDEITAG